MKTSFLLIPVAGAILTSCVQTKAISTREVVAMNRSTDPLPSGITLRMSVKEGRAGVKNFPARQVKVGESFRIAEQRDFIYPSAYKPAAASVDLTSAIPATPTEFQKIETGLEADLKAERVGALIIIKGTITVTDFQGFSRMGGDLGRPIVDARGRLITDNSIEMPKFATYSTPVYAAVRPGGSCGFEISHPKKGSSVTFSLAAGE